MVAITTQHVRSAQIKEKCVIHNYMFLGYVGSFCGAKTKISLRCPEHGEFLSTINNFVNNNRRCSKCRKGHPLDKDTAISEARTALLESGVQLIEVAGEFKGSLTKLDVRCMRHPSNTWVCSISAARQTKMIRRGIRGCSECLGEVISKATVRDFSKYSERVHQKSLERGLAFVGIRGGYSGHSTDLEISCPTHGSWYCKLNKFLSDDTFSCPGCVTCGFDQTKTGYTYLLSSDCGRYLKVGVSNYPKKRLARLRRETPFHFKVLEIVKFEVGKDALDLERGAHRKYQSAGLKGFDGCTEWLLFSDGVVRDIRHASILSGV